MSDIVASNAAMEACGRSNDVGGCMSALGSIASQMVERATKADITVKEMSPTITFAEAVAALKQVKVHDEPPRRHTNVMLARRIDDRGPRKDPEEGADGGDKGMYKCFCLWQEQSLVPQQPKVHRDHGGQVGSRTLERRRKGR